MQCFRRNRVYIGEGKIRQSSVLSYQQKGCMKMKRMTTICILLAMLISILCGCTKPAAEVPLTEGKEESASIETADMAESNEVIVSTVDELLAAIAPDKVIIMEPGTYDLTAASNYGDVLATQYYTWTDVYDGYELIIKGVSNLTIRGTGMEETILSAGPRYANVITFASCSNITLEGFTAGHTVDPAECMGGVIYLDSSSNVTMDGVGLYGCGVIGIRTFGCQDLILKNSHIYDCSDSGLFLRDSSGITVDSCNFYDLGREQYGGNAVFDLSNTSDMVIENCEIYSNSVQSLIYTSNLCTNVQMLNNRFHDNRIRNCAFTLRSDCLILDGNTFENDVIRIWYDPEGVDSGFTAKSKEGTSVTEEMLDDMLVKIKVEKDLPEQAEVHVKTVDELLAAIAPNTKIILDAQLYDLSTATGYGKGSSDFYYWEENHDGPGLVIDNVDNLTICSDDVKGHTISALPRYANVLTFNECTNILVEGFTAGHTVEPGYCVGGVICFRDSDSVAVNNCSLYGCGTLGVDAQYSGDVTVTNCEIYECSYGGIRMWSVDGINVADCTFRDLGGSSIAFLDCKNAILNGEAVSGSYDSND